jgi:hypothetical protein
MPRPSDIRCAVARPAPACRGPAARSGHFTTVVTGTLRRCIQRHDRTGVGQPIHRQRHQPARPPASPCARTRAQACRTPPRPRRRPLQSSTGRSSRPQSPGTPPITSAAGSGSERDAFSGASAVWKTGSASWPRRSPTWARGVRNSGQPNVSTGGSTTSRRPARSAGNVSPGEAFPPTVDIPSQGSERPLSPVHSTVPPAAGPRGRDRPRCGATESAPMIMIRLPFRRLVGATPCMLALVSVSKLVSKR